MEYKALFTNAHQLNYDEVVRRLKHWSTQGQGALNRPSAQPAIVILVSLLERNRLNLYFEEK